MRLRVLSDLHLEFCDDPSDVRIGDEVECDVVILAGDIANGTKGLEWAAETFALREIIYVMGNHEYYDHDLHYLLAQARTVASRLGIHLLEKDEVRLGGVRFLGCTLWSGFDSSSYAWRELSDLAHIAIADFEHIGNGDKAFTPLDMTMEYDDSRIWLQRMLDSAMPSVVITHFSPARVGLNPRFRGEDKLTPYFHNDLVHLLGGAVPLWIHGHHHYSFDEIVAGRDGRTRIVSNQHGYAGEPTRFDPDFIVEV